DSSARVGNPATDLCDSPSDPPPPRSSKVGRAMPIKLSCDCGKKLQVKDDLAGKKVKCPGCGAVVPVPAAVAEAPPPAPKPKMKAPPPREEEEVPPQPQDEEEAPPPPEEEEAPAPKRAKKKSSASELMVTNKFVVKELSKRFSTRKRYELLDGDTGK